MGGGGNSFSHAEGGGTKSCGVVFIRSLDVFAILKGGEAQKVSTL